MPAGAVHIFFVNLFMTKLYIMLSIVLTDYLLPRLEMTVPSMMVQHGLARRLIMVIALLVGMDWIML